MNKVGKSEPQEDEGTEAHGERGQAVSPLLTDLHYFV